MIVALDAEAATGIARTQPDEAERLRAGFADGTLTPLLTTAHGAEGALLSPEELADELRLDEETLQLLFGVTFERRGFCGHADVAALEAAGIDFVIGDVAEACRVGERLIALPRATETPLQAAAKLTPPWLPRGEWTQGGELPAALHALAALGAWCADAFGLRRVPGIAAAALVDEGWRLERLPTRARVPLVRRRGLQANRRAWVSAYEWCDVLGVEARVPGLAAHATEPLPRAVLPTLRALADEHGAGDPMARAEAAYEELGAFRFLGAQRWRALMTSLRDAFALLASRRDVDWSIAAPVEEREREQPMLRLVEPSVPLN